MVGLVMDLAEVPALGAWAIEDGDNEAAQ
jgi:hypothetical protein